jgi:hypothetical protein
MEIAGHRCRVCKRRIILSSEGKFCAHCGTVVHLACEPKATCEDCGQPFHDFQKPKADPVSEAVLPRSLRPTKDGGPMVAALLIIATVLVFLFICFFLS